MHVDADQSVKHCIEKITQEQGAIDVLINNIFWCYQVHSGSVASVVPK
jgi:hypothetical protein